MHTKNEINFHRKDKYSYFKNYTRLIIIIINHHNYDLS